MGLDQIINSTILDIFPLMPSSGAWPFTMISIGREQLPKLKTERKLTAAFQLLVLKRTDYDASDLFDYVRKSTEYQHLEHHNQDTFLEKYNKISNNKREFSQWAERTTSLAIGLITHTAISKGIQISPVDIDLSALDEALGFGKRRLNAFQLFDAHQIGSSSLLVNVY